MVMKTYQKEQIIETIAREVQTTFGYFTQPMLIKKAKRHGIPESSVRYHVTAWKTKKKRVEIPCSGKTKRYKLKDKPSKHVVISRNKILKQSQRKGIHYPTNIDKLTASEIGICIIEAFEKNILHIKNIEKKYQSTIKKLQGNLVEKEKEVFLLQSEITSTKSEMAYLTDAMKKLKCVVNNKKESRSIPLTDLGLSRDN